MSISKMHLSLLSAIILGIGPFILAASDASPSKVSAEAGHKFILSSRGLAEKGMWKCTPGVGDVNKDGHRDIASISRLGTGPRVWLGNGNSEWVDSSRGLDMRGSCGGGTAIGDVDKDGIPDLVVADHCTGVHVYLGDGRGEWKQVVRALSPARFGPLPEEDENWRLLVGTEDIAIGDVNGDGFPDLVVCASEYGGIHVYLGDGTGTNWAQSSAEGLPSARDPALEQDVGWANQVLLIDVNKDGHLDIVASYHEGPRVWLGDGKGKWRASSAGLPEPTVYGLYRGIAVGDVNADGALDIVAANIVNGPEMYFQRPDGSWAQAPDVFPEMQGGAVACDLGDLDGDGIAELVVGGRLTQELGNNYGIFVLKRHGSEWKREERTDLPSRGLSVVWGIRVTDLNEDGRPDILVSSGGVTPGEEQARPARKAKAPNPVASVQLVPEEALPRMQVWLNTPG
ncbi:MAG: VCBS repeat-containing protein [Syntrophobacteraceae bacterium]